MSAEQRRCSALENTMADTLASWIEKFLEYLRYQRNASAHTIRTIPQIFNSFIPS